MNKEQHTSNSTLATEVIAQLKNELFKLETETGEGTNKLLMAERALLMLKDNGDLSQVLMQLTKLCILLAQRKNAQRMNTAHGNIWWDMKKSCSL